MKVRSLSFRIILPLAAILVLALLAPPSTGLAQGTNAYPLVFPPNSSPFGLTYAQWSARWWQWAWSIPASTNPILDASGADCGVGQSGPVWFLAGTGGNLTTAVRNCTIPFGKAMLFPMITYGNDYPCPGGKVVKPGQLQEFLTKGAKSVIDQIDTLQAQVDGVRIPLSRLFKYRATSKLFTFTADPSLNAALGDACINGETQWAVSDGYWIMLASLSPGRHTITFGGGLPGWSTEVTYNLTIKPIWNP